MNKIFLPNLKASYYNLHLLYLLEHQEKLIKDAERVAASQRLEEARQEELERQEAAKAEPAREIGFISVSIGDGLTDIFKGLGVDVLIDSGKWEGTSDLADAYINWSCYAYGKG